MSELKKGEPSEKRRDVTFLSGPSGSVRTLYPDFATRGDTLRVRLYGGLRCLRLFHMFE